MELWDAYDRHGNRLGIDLARGEAVPDGMYHIISDIVVRHTNGDYLLMLRDPGKPFYPNMYELTAGGSALKGESALDCARRELIEETGIDAGTLTPLGMSVREGSHSFYYVYACETDRDPDAVRLQPGETVGYKWVNAQALREMIEAAEVVPINEHVLKYLGFEDLAVRLDENGL